MLVEIGLLVAVILTVKVLKTKSEKIHGVYSQPGPFYWIKWILFYVLYSWRIRKAPKYVKKYDDGSDLRYLEDEGKISNDAQGEKSDFGAGERTKAPPHIMERTQPVADSHFAIDAVYFNGFEATHFSIKDDVTVVMAFTARYRNYAEILFFVHVPGVGFLQHPSHPDRIICDAGSDDYCYHGQGMTIEMLEPMRRWRLKYNGLMRLMDVADRKVAKTSDRLVHVKFSLIWRSYSNFIDFDTDISASCMANAFASEEWSRDFFDRVKKYHDHQSHYEQWGQMRGIIQVEDNEPLEVILRGLRDHSFSKRDWRHFRRYLICIIHLEDGTSINVTSICMDVTLTRLTLGYVIHPNQVKENVTEVDLKLWEYGEDGVIPKEVIYSFTAGGKKYTVSCQIRIIPEFYNGFEWEGKLVETLADYHVNGIPGRGIAEFCYRHEGDRRTFEDCPKSTARRYSDPEVTPTVFDEALIVKLQDDLCRKETLTGGKGCQLAVLKKWSFETDKFTVPNGFCITTSAYNKHVIENEDLQSKLNELKNISSWSDDQIKETCNKISVAFEKSSITTTLKELILKEYAGLNHEKSPLVAVRSSAVGEDSSDLSAAGQLDTFLGISSIDEIIRAVKKCWACQYSYTALEYRRQHGQPVISSMGVVVQLLAEQTKISGVMFTQHPVTGNPGHILINANYGLGETVVSGAAEPDTIVVACNPNNNPEILSKKVGSKAEVSNVDGSGTLRHSTVEINYANELCLSEEQIFQLADLAGTIQTFAGSPRDIEWTVSESGKINLVQSRPITSDPTDTDFEIHHEFDSAYSSENYILTSANIGEMMSGAATPLTYSTFLRSIEYSMQHFFESASPRGLKEFNDTFVCTSHGHLLLNYLEMVRLHNFSMLGSRKESIDVNIFGRVCNEISEEEYLHYHKNKFSILRRAINSFRFWRYLFGSKTEFMNMVKNIDKVQLRGQNSRELYRSISENLAPYYAESWRSHLGYAGLSGVSTTVLMMILSKGNPDWKTEHYSDVAMIYSSCENVITLNAPTLVRETARYISESEDKDHFLKSSSEDAVEWLVASESKAGETFRKLMDKCGHRCLNEADMHEKSWASHPAKLVPSLQAMVKSYSDDKSPKMATSVESVMEKLKSPVTTFWRFVLKRFIPRARRSIAGRELGKSNVIKISDIFKQAYWVLAGMLEKEGYLPNKDLTFFLTHGEIGRLLRTRSARLVTRAVRRRRLHKQASERKFGEIVSKIPAVPINSQGPVVEEGGSVHIHGLPVGIGTIRGRASVIHSLDEAINIQPGDILIVRTTDVGWAPYFPLISGLVTDIGGLLSHGAIVAREYGLPCVVGTKKASVLFKSGDFVEVNGSKGHVRKIAIQ